MLGTVNQWLGGGVAAFPVTASGSPSPDRFISYSGASGSPGIGIATSSGILFITDVGSNGVYEVYSTVNGTQTPISKLPVPAPEDVKVGP